MSNVSGGILSDFAIKVREEFPSRRMFQFAGSFGYFVHMHDNEYAACIDGMEILRIAVYDDGFEILEV